MSGHDETAMAAVVRKALKGLNLEKAQAHSQIDHHTPGLNYLNLQRSDKFTLKLYLIEEERNENGCYLVFPHSHRYEFNTLVLAGHVSNVVFKDVELPPAPKSEQQLWEEEISGGGDLQANRFRYSREKGMFGKAEPTWLTIDTAQSAGYNRGQSYYMKTNQIHTLRTWPEPTLLLLSQFHDREVSSSIYLPHDQYELPERTGRTPTLEETEAMRVRCLELLK